ncbi:DUF559 domain-containing protein [Nocardioides sp.]|uniref:DUF559 domain-containing protein n=1 Tax=Nocardioides sp. TaxID=35761 RepID=UPI002735C4AA|nr:DUF559 domain-containing protein [Nocardioides sp.]MDP3894185.1 DUF559 domain-containing protein [Nocardioides sp.]
MHPLGVPSLDTRRPFTRADAIAAGIDPRLLRGSRFRRLFRGVYVDAAVVDSPDLRPRAALRLFGPTAFASHASAARIKRLAIPTLPDEHVSVLHAADRRPRPGLRCHVAVDPYVRVVDGVRVSDHGQMFVELASLLGLVDLVVVGDQLARLGWLGPVELVAHCRLSRLPNSSRALAAAGYVRAKVDSPMETRLRMLLVLAGLPEPRVNLLIRDADGVPCRRYDLSYPEVRVIVEYDGRHHIERIESWESDLDRREAIDDDGWRILVVTARGIYREPERTVLRVWRLLRRRRLAGVPVRPGADWRPHFPGRG